MKKLLLALLLCTAPVLLAQSHANNECWLSSSGTTSLGCPSSNYGVYGAGAAYVSVSHSDDSDYSTVGIFLDCPYYVTMEWIVTQHFVGLKAFNPNRTMLADATVYDGGLEDYWVNPMLESYFGCTFGTAMADSNQ